MATQVARIDGAVAVEIPEDLLEKANLSVDDPVGWTLTSTGALALDAHGAAPAIEPPDDCERWQAEEIQVGLAEVEAGQSVPHEKVIEWLRSWGSAHEFPPPQ
ncbi:MAG TPA: hypothetical protein VGF96_00495 [Terracidiphilus sp.]|jgi:antitoxin component of MazEF toxin-antitoxin module